MRKPLSPATMDNAVMLREKGIKLEQVSEILGIGGTTLSRILQAYKAAQDNDTQQLAEIGKTSRPVAEWACARANINPTILDGKSEPEAKPEPKNDNTAIAFVSLLEAIKGLTAAVDAIDKRLSAMQLTQQGFRGDMSQQIGKVVEAIHVEGDILTKEHDKMVDLLGGIKSNTKRGPSL